MTGPAADAYAWDPHLVAWSVLVVVAASVILGHRRLSHHAAQPDPWEARQKVQFGVGLFGLAIAFTWPVADLAAHWSLTLLVVQRLILLLFVAPQLLLGIPYDVLAWLTRPPAVDSALAGLQRPVVAVSTVTALSVGSMVPVVVRAASSAQVVRGIVDLAVVSAGFVLWTPVLGRIPGILRLKPVVRFIYLVFQAVVPAFLSFIYIFSVHPLYDTFSRSAEAIHLRPLNDQQVAGFVSKLSMIFVLMTVGAVVLARAPTSEEEYDRQFGRNDPLVWADVERQFERTDRRLAKRGGVQAEPESATPEADSDDGDPQP